MLCAAAGDGSGTSELDGLALHFAGGASPRNSRRFIHTCSTGHEGRRKLTAAQAKMATCRWFLGSPVRGPVLASYAVQLTGKSGQWPGKG